MGKEMDVKAGKGTRIKPDTKVATPDPRLEIVLKCDSIGSMEGVMAALSKVTVTGVEIQTIHSGVGSVTQSDVMMAETASRLIVGFQVEPVPGLERVLRERRVEVRLYDIIYKLSDDIRVIAESMAPGAPEEEIIGLGKVVALFKSVKKGIIIGCEVQDGHLAVGQHFRIISAMGPIYSGTIESLHVEEKTVQKAATGQKVGIKIRNFKQAKIGDFVESYRLPSSRKIRPWGPKDEIIRR